MDGLFGELLEGKTAQCIALGFGGFLPSIAKIFGTSTKSPQFCILSFELLCKGMKLSLGQALGFVIVILPIQGSPRDAIHRSVLCDCLPSLGCVLSSVLQPGGSGHGQLNGLDLQELLCL